MSHAIARAIRDADNPDHTYAWIITRDRFAENFPDVTSEVGERGPSLATDEMFALVESQGREFRMCDEGDIDSDNDSDLGDLRGVVYEGRIWTQDEEGSETDFGPLVDFGTPNYGCTEIQYRDANGVWVGL